jgi:hypothetical protein
MIKFYFHGTSISLGETMNKPAVLLAAIAVIAGVVLAAWLLLPRQQPEQTRAFDDFENGFGEWTTDADVPEDPNAPGENIAWSVERASNNSFSGTHSVLMWIDGRQDNGTIWIERKLTLQPNSAKSVNVTFQLWSESKSFNTIAAVVGYIGEENPEIENDFQVLGAANQVSGWKPYTLSGEVNTGEVHVALGISVRWETEMRYFIDSVEIKVT